MTAGKTPATYALLLVAFLIGATSLAGCADSEADVTFEGDFEVEGCGQFFPWSPRVAGFTKVETSGAGLMRFYEFESRPPTQNNNFVLFVDDIDTIRDSIGSPINVNIGLEDQPAETANAALTINSFCDDQGDISAQFEGTVTFEDFGLSDGDRIRGSLEGVFRNARNTDEVLGSNVTATFSFVYRPNEPYQPFPQGSHP
jgi:hypothetical protein